MNYGVLSVITFADTHKAQTTIEQDGILAHAMKMRHAQLDEIESTEVIAHYILNALPALDDFDFDADDLEFDDFDFDDDDTPFELEFGF